MRFHHKVDAPIAEGFETKVLKRRRALIHEEYSEVCEAIKWYLDCKNVRRYKPEQLTELQREVCAELVDLIYVTVGTFVELGIDPQPVWAAIHAANMQKEPNPNIEGGKGKAVKPEGWQKPRIVLRSFAGVIPLIVGSSRSLAATSFRRLNVPGAAQHVRALAQATTPQSEPKQPLQTPFCTHHHGPDSCCQGCL